MADLNAIAESLMKGQAPKVKELVQAAVDEGISPQQILTEGLIAGMNVLGKKFKANEVYIPEVLIAARAMHAGMGILKPLLAKSGAKAAKVFMIGTVKGDLHDIGKNLVAMMMEGAGFDVADIGIDVTSEKFVEMVREKKPEVLGMSALLTTTMPAMKSAVEAIKAAGLKDSVKIVIGGAPITQSFADEIGADGYAPDAASAVDVSKKLLGMQ
ncbi:MAG: methyltransferase [Elusimicrobia bacterium RIFOXYA2_FULL_39_19]|nr:MAG: methyltransferase [Elusimicrobia bacterium RIFOXYA2_FULL_39_19]